MKKILVSLATVLAMLFPATATTVAVAPAASADTPGCVNWKEWSQVEYGWARSRVHRLFDTSGSVISQTSTEQLRYYPRCNGDWEFINYRDSGKYYRVTEMSSW